jgi:hypothetical protein
VQVEGAEHGFAGAAGQGDAMSAGPLHKPTPLPQSQEAQAAWTVGWWQGKVIGFALGMATAVLFGWLR